MKILLFMSLRHADLFLSEPLPPNRLLLLGLSIDKNKTGMTFVVFRMPCFHYYSWRKIINRESYQSLNKIILISRSGVVEWINWSLIIAGGDIWIKWICNYITSCRSKSWLTVRDSPFRFAFLTHQIRGRNRNQRQHRLVRKSQK